MKSMDAVPQSSVQLWICSVVVSRRLYLVVTVILVDIGFTYLLPRVRCISFKKIYSNTAVSRSDGSLQSSQSAKCTLLPYKELV